MLKITLDPGHGENENKGVLADYYEGKRMFRLAEYLKTELEKYGAQVEMTKNRVSDDPTLSARGNAAIKNSSSVFLSLHSNAASSEKACGVSSFYSVKLPESRELLTRLVDRVTAVMAEQTGVTYKRGVMTRTYENGGRQYDYYGVIRNSVGGDVRYSFIIEHGFHTNERECAFLLDDGNLKKIARAEAEVFAEYFSLTKEEDTKEKDTKEEASVYTVQKGDTLTKIASLHGVGVSALAEYNEIENPNLIVVGQKIRIPENEDNTVTVGDVVRLKDGVTTYFPGGNPFSPWVKNYDYTVMKDADSLGKPVYRGGDLCVLLGEKINRKTAERGGAIKSWCSINYIDKVK